MKKLFIWCFVLIAGLVFGYLNRDILVKSADAFLYESPCKTIPYRLGDIDSRFNLSEKELMADAGQAGAIWNNASGKELFVYDPQAQLSINLVYDERQALSTQIDEVDKSLAQKEDELKPEIAAYEQHSADFQRRLTQLNQDIESWNSKGGAPPEEFDKLIARQKALQQEGYQLSATARSLNQSTDQYNTQVRDLSQKVGTFNEALKEKPEEGLYISDERGKRIYIYFNTSRGKLIHTLAHEMGHALDMGHVSQQLSVMYPKTSDTIVLSQEDINELNEVCRKRSLSERFEERITFIAELIKEGKTDVLLDNIVNGLQMKQ